MREDSFVNLKRIRLILFLIFFAYTLLIIRTKDPLLIGMVLVLWSISEYSQKLYRNEFEKLRVKSCELDEKLIQSQKLAAIGELSTGIAHEINNPLAIMSQELEWIRYNIDSEGRLTSDKVAEIKDSISELGRQINRCRDVTHRLLALARKADLVFQGTDINSVVEDVALLVEKEAKLKGTSVIRILNSSIPEIKTDPPLLKQVLLNLLNNALSAVGENGRIIIRTGIQNSHVVIEVEDNGPGIPQELLGRVFDPFFTTKEEGKGTGLGLSISQNIAHKLGGYITAESQVSKGTVFKVHLPMEVMNAKARR